MGTFKDLWDGEHRSFYRWAAFATAVFLLVELLGSNNVFRWIKSGIQLHNQETQIRKYQEEISSMDEQIKALTTNKDSLEKFAREKFHFAAPGDDVYLIEK